MKKVKVSFDTWVQLLGMLGVLGGLVFVGLEMQQSQRIALASQQTQRIQASIDAAKIVAEKSGRSKRYLYNLIHRKGSTNDKKHDKRQNISRS